MSTQEEAKDSFMLKSDTNGNYWIEKVVKLPVFGQKATIGTYSEE